MAGDGDRASETSDCSSLDCWAPTLVTTATSSVAPEVITPMDDNTTLTLIQPPTSMESLRYVDDEDSCKSLGKTEYTPTVENENIVTRSRLNNTNSSRQQLTSVVTAYYTNPVFDSASLDNTLIADVSSHRACASNDVADGNGSEEDDRFLACSQCEEIDAKNKMATAAAANVGDASDYAADVSAHNSPTREHHVTGNISDLTRVVKGHSVDYDINTQTSVVSVRSLDDSPVKKPYSLPSLSLFGLHRVKQGIILHQVCTT